MNYSPRFNMLASVRLAKVITQKRRQKETIAEPVLHRPSPTWIVDAVLKIFIRENSRWVKTRDDILTGKAPVQADARKMAAYLQSKLLQMKHKEISSYFDWSTSKTTNNACREIENLIACDSQITKSIIGEVTALYGETFINKHCGRKVDSKSASRPGVKPRADALVS